MPHARRSMRRGTAQLIVVIDAFVARPLAPQPLDFVDGANSAASAEGCAVQSRRRAAKFKYFWKCIAAQQGISESGMKDVACSGCVHRLHTKRGAVVESRSVPREDALASKCR